MTQRSSVRHTITCIWLFTNVCAHIVYNKLGTKLVAVKNIA